MICVSIACPIHLFPMVPLEGQSAMVLQAHSHSQTNFASFNIAWSSFRGCGDGVQYTRRHACKHIYCFVIFFLSSSRGYILGCCKGFWIYLVTHGWCLWIYLCVFINNCFCVISMYIHVQIMYVCLCICISPCSAKK